MEAVAGHHNSSVEPARPKRVGHAYLGDCATLRLAGVNASGVLLVVCRSGWQDVRPVSEFFQRRQQTRHAVANLLPMGSPKKIPGKKGRVNTTGLIANRSILPAVLS